MLQRKIKIIVSFVKKKFYLVFFLGVISMCIGVYGIFRIPQIYPFWLNHGLEKFLVLVNPRDSKVFFEIGESYFGHGKSYDIKKAEIAYTKATELRPDFLEAHYQLGRVYFIRGKFESALSEMNTVLHLNSEFKKAYYMYGLINGYKGDLDQAIWGFEEFIKRDDFNWAGYNDLAWIYFKKGDYQKTKEIAEKGLTKAYHNPWLSNIYGTALLNLGEKEKAQEQFQIALDATNEMTPENWGGAYPGNNPKDYATGLEETKSVIEHNLEITNK